MALDHTIGTASQALDVNQRLATLLGRGVVIGGRPSEGARPFAVDLLDATTKLGDEIIETPAISVDLREYAAVEKPRKVVIYIAPADEGAGADEFGHIRVAAGEPADERPDGAVRFNTYEPAPPDLADEVAAPIAEVWLGANAQQVTDEDIRDRRLTPELAAYALESRRASADELLDGAGVAHSGELADGADLWTPTTVRDVINTDPTHGSTAPHNYFSGVHADLSGNRSDNHHPRYTDPETRTAVIGTLPITELAGTSAYAPGQHLAVAEGGALKSGYGTSSYGYTSAGQVSGETGPDAVWENPPRAEAPVLATGTLTHTGGSATTVRLEGVTPTQTSQVTVGIGVSVATPPAWAGSYGYNLETTRYWDAPGGEIDVEVTLSWSTDPGLGNDLDLQWAAYDLSPSTVAGLYSGEQARAAIADTEITPGGMLVGSSFDLPVYATTGDAPAAVAGDMIVTSGASTDAFGLWVHDGVGWHGPFVKDLTSLSELLIDTPKDWGTFRIRNVGTPQAAGDVIRPQDITDHTADASAHHAKTTSSDIDHAGMANVQPGQHHAPVPDDEMVEAVAGTVMSIPITASSIPDGQAARAHACLGEDETLVLTRGSMDTETSTIPSGLTLQIADAEDGSVYYRQSEATATGTAASPLATVVGPADLDIRVRNQSGLEVAAGGDVSYHILRVLRTYGSEITTPADNETRDVVGRQGVVIQPKIEMDGVRMTISQNVDGYTTAYIQEASTGDVLAQSDIRSRSNGDTVNLTASEPLQTGETYYVSIDAGGSRYTRGKYATSSNQYPYTSSDFDIVDGVYSAGGARSSTGRYNVSSVQAMFVD